MRNIVKVMTAAAALLLLVGTGIPAAFAAAKCPHMFGSQQRVAGAGGPVAQEWTATDLQPGADLLPGYSAVGKLWEVGVSVSAMNGAVTPSSVFYVVEYPRARPSKRRQREQWSSIGARPASSTLPRPSDYGTA